MTTMRHEQFRIGRSFYTATGAWVCTYVGTRTIVAVKKARLDEHPDGPPYSIAEASFDEYDLDGCVKTKAQAKDQLGFDELKCDDDEGCVVTAPVAPHILRFHAEARREKARSKPRSKRRAPMVK